jgi:flagellar hook-associated protein 3 FlgL
MRVSNETLRSTFLMALQQAQRRVLDTQEQVGSGRRINKPSDDPVAAARVAHLEASLSRLDQFASNGAVARTQLGLEEEALGGTIDHLQRIRELVLQGNSATASQSDRRIIAAEIREYRDALVAIGNTTDVDGRHLFGGFAERTTPFTIDPTGVVTYNGDQGQRQVQISETRFVVTGDSGAEIFQRIRTGNGTFALATGGANTGTGVLGAGTVTDPAAYIADDYTISFLTPTTYEVRDGANTLVTSGTYSPPEQSIAFRGMNIELDGAPEAGDTFSATPSSQRDVFAIINDVIAALEVPTNNSASRAGMNSALGQRLVDLDNAVSHVIDARAEIGARVRAVDQEETLGLEFNGYLSEALSQVRDLDYAEALNLLSQQMFGLEVAQQSYARTQGLSLFKFL